MLPFYESRDGRVHVSRFTQMNFPPHLHGEIELIYMLSGQMSLVTSDGSVSLHSGDMGLSFPGAIHGYADSTKDSTGVMMIFPPTIAPYLQKTVTTHRPVSAKLSSERVHPDVRYLTANLLGEPADQCALCASLSLILARAVAASELRSIGATGDQALLVRLIGYLSSRYQEPLTLEAVANALGSSPFHLSHVLNSQLHMGFRAYVNTLRIDYAQQLLRQNDMSITRICYECGFESLRTFNRVFFALCQKTPREYRTAHLSPTSKA